MSCDIRYRQGLARVEVQNFQNVVQAHKWANEKGLNEYLLIVHR